MARQVVCGKDPTVQKSPMVKGRAVMRVAPLLKVPMAALLPMVTSEELVELSVRIVLPWENAARVARLLKVLMVVSMRMGKPDRVVRQLDPMVLLQAVEKPAAP